MRRITVACGILLAIGGCTTSPQQMREEGPIRSFTTTKPEQQAAECILYAWQNESLAGVHYDVTLQPRPGAGKSVISAGGREMVDVTSAEHSTRVDFYSSSSMSWITNRRIASLGPCL